MAREKVEIELDNKQVVEIGGSKEVSGEELVLVSGWNPGQAPHFSVPFGVLSELVATGDLITLGNYKKTPVVSAEDILEFVKTAVEEKVGGDFVWKTVRTGGVGIKNLKDDKEEAIKMVMDATGQTREEVEKAIKAAKQEKKAEPVEEEVEEPVEEEVEE